MLEAAKKGEEKDKEAYKEAYKEKYGKEPEEKESTLEFHFYSTLKTITVRRTSEYDNLAICGKDGSGCVWLIDFSCDMNKCVGFNEPGSGLLKGDVRIGRRGDISSYTMTAPDAKPGYKFKQWEIISARKNQTNGVLIGKYIAIYEKI